MDALRIDDDATTLSTSDAVQEPHTDTVPQRKPYILCIEDDHPVLDSVCQALVSLGHNLVNAPNSDRALTLMTAYMPDVLLIDLTQKDGESWKLYNEIRHNKSLNNVVIIDVSARSTQLRRTRVDEFPAIEDYVPQPTDIERLVRAIEVLIT